MSKRISQDQLQDVRAVVRNISKVLDDVRPILEPILANIKTEKSALITQIVSNSQFTPLEFQDKSIDDLRKIHRAIYGGRRMQLVYGGKPARGLVAQMQQNN